MYIIYSIFTILTSFGFIVAYLVEVSHPYWHPYYTTTSIALSSISNAGMIGNY